MNVRRTVLQSLVCFGLCLSPGFGAAPAHAFLSGEADIYGMVEYFTWREYDDAGAQLLREAGPRFGVGLSYHRVFQNQATLKPRLELYGGHVDYVGQTQAGDPVKSNTNYFAFKLEIDAGGKLGGQHFSVEPFGGLGFRMWDRDIEDSVTATGTPAYGYREEWATVYIRAGARGNLVLSQDSKLFFEAGVKLPLYSENYISDVAYEDITLEPEGRISPFAEAGWKAGAFKLSAFYDSMRFAKSAVVIVYDPFYGYVGYWQPESISHVLGIRIGRSF